MTMALGSILSIEFTRDSARLISISRRTVVSGNSISPASGFYAPEEDPDPNKVALTLLTPLHLAWRAPLPSSSYHHGHVPPSTDPEGWELQYSQRSWPWHPSPCEGLGTGSDSSFHVAPYNLR